MHTAFLLVLAAVSVAVSSRLLAGRKYSSCSDAALLDGSRIPSVATGSGSVSAHSSSFGPMFVSRLLTDGGRVRLITGFIGGRKELQNDVEARHSVAL